MNKTERQLVDILIENAIKEDVGDGDHTSLATIPSEAMGSAKLLAKDNGILAGIEVASMVFKKVDADLIVETFFNDGDKIVPGDLVLTVSGRSQSILTAERTALNFIQRMSGIATYTNSIVEKISDTNTKLLDTRKTTPNNRIVEKIAVKIGGGTNHRFGLFDMVMIKDNHIDFAGGIVPAIDSTISYLKRINKDLKIEIEVRNFDELTQVIERGSVDRVMLDNFNPDDLKKAVEIIDGRFETEASGGITEKSIREYALTGVDFISVGALTHQIKSLDLSLVTS